MKKDTKYREIPYNYTSLSDKEIILNYFNEETWDILNELRKHRVTGRSAKLLFEVIGDIFIIDRNPYIYNDFLDNKEKIKKLKKQHLIKLDIIKKGAENNELVLNIIERAKEIDSEFITGFSKEKNFRKKALKVISEYTDKSNIHFSAFHKVSHVTDATDWRVEYPEIVVYPESVNEIPELINAAQKLDMKIIPRGGGTGLTGGAVPVVRGTMIINTEKLRKIYPIEMLEKDINEKAIIKVEAGVITDKVTDFCKEKGFVFATDPTSSWASTIGGNISENAGGKKCVMWGTAIDNIYTYEIINASGEIIEIKRRDHPYRKIEPEDEVIFDVYNKSQKNNDLIETITLKGTDVRKKGVGKDITNKALGGLPGVQKEGGDGIITSAEFVLYKPFSNKKTIALEFFGKNLIKASKAIVAILDSFKNNKISYLTALEHFDEKYVLAINYRNKSSRSDIPKAVLLIDIEGNDLQNLEKVSQEVVNLVKEYDAEGFIAFNEEERELFWQDRKNLGAIARHTNAFKLNEDVVIPIHSLPDFADFIEFINIEKELANNIGLIDDIFILLKRDVIDVGGFISSKITSYETQLIETINQLKNYKKSLKDTADSNLYESCEYEKSPSLFELIRDNCLTIDIEKSVIQNFYDIFHGYDDLLKEFKEVVDYRQRRKLIIATHMHAGDGNIHVNIPVLSNDYEMMLEADEAAGIIMEKTKELGGVISGEHGIGLTKLKFIDQDVLDKYAEYKKKADPQDVFNPGKLRSDFPENKIYTPSLNLIETEAFILEAADLENLTTSISGCVRCGKCKEVCNTHYAEGTMFYSPRNKILGVSLITEAVLYEAQTSNSLSFRNFSMLREISDHCTGCHNCFNPCPVNIDFGDVTLAIKKIQSERKRSKFKFIVWFVLFYLRRKGYYINKLLRIAFMKIGYSLQRLAFYPLKPFNTLLHVIMPKIAGIMKSRFPKAGDKTVREVFGLSGVERFYSFQKPEVEIKKSVVYFPGCGSERMFSEISFAVIALLYNAGVRIVIAPEYLCCGYPMLFNGKVKQAKEKSYENRVIFHRMADTIGYMDIEDVVVSCGTCHEMLSKYQIENIFPNSQIIDVNEFVVRENYYKTTMSEKLLYHDPCHSPLKNIGYKATFKELLGVEPINITNCCGEGGTQSLSTPDISNTIRERKQHNIEAKSDNNDKNVTVITTCPSCTQGLSRIKGKQKVDGKSLVVFSAEKFLGQNWQSEFIKDVKRNNGVEEIIL